MKANKRFLVFLNSCIKSDKNSWDEFVRYYSSLIYSYIIKTLKRYNYPIREDEQHDIFHRVFLSLIESDCKRLKNFRGENERSFMAYIREITFHITVDFLRERRNYIELEQIQNVIFYEDQYENLAKQDLAKIIRIIKNELCDRHKYLFRLLYEEEWELPEIAQLMNMKINAVHQLKFRMVKKIIEIAKVKDLYKELKMLSIKAVA